MKKLEDAKRLGKILSDARYEAGISQLDMAAAMGVSRNTITNLEKGVGRMTIKQFMDWFDILGLNPTSYMLQYLNPYELYGLTAENSDDEIESALITIVQQLTNQQKRALLYILLGPHHSDPNSIIQLSLAHLHTPLANRVTIARTVIDNYEICDSLGNLVDTEHVLPDMETLNQAYEFAKKAVMKGHIGYTISDDNTI